MAKNKITFEMERGEDGRCEYRFTGSLRQPTFVEIQNYINDNRLHDNIDDFFGIAFLSFKEEGYIPPEVNTAIVLRGYDGGTGDGSCPVCGHERDMGGDRCPTCLKPWE